MIINLWLNGNKIQKDIPDGMYLLDFLRENGCHSVKRGCETSNCGLCTVLMENKPILSCSTLAARANEKHVYTLEGLQAEAVELGEFLADQGVEQCGFCSPGLVMTVLAMKRELANPSESEIKEYLAGTLCRCSGYMGQHRAISLYLQKGGK